MSAPGKTMEGLESSSVAPQNSRGTKRKRVHRFLAEHQLDGILITLQSNFAWYTDGGRNYINMAADEGIADLLITTTEEHLFTSTTESGRLSSEELSGVIPRVHLASWWDDARRREIVVSLFGDRIETDTGDLRREFSRLRYSLLADEVVRYRQLGKDVAASLWEAAQEMHPGMTEDDLAAELSCRLVRNAIVPIVLLVAFDERVAAYRHPLPSGKVLKSLALLSVCGRRHGLIISATRLISLSAVSSELKERHRAVSEVNAWLMHHTRPGVRIADLFEDLKEQYKNVGYPGEWQVHHQGGATGYSTRDYRASPLSAEVVQTNQAFAWNPTITSTKAEDTIIVSESGTEVLTLHSPWPSLEIDIGGKIFHSADILVLH